MGGSGGGEVIFSTATETAEEITDSNTTYIIREIAINGNKKTRPAIILRELSFQVNEQYPLNEIVEKFHETKKQLMNTGMFRSVVVSLKSLQGFDVFVNIDVEERWYIYPVPYVRMVDHNFQQWLTERNGDLSRVNYGIKLTYRNITGRNDKLNLSINQGYTKQAALRYEGLFLDRQLKWSTNLSVAFGKKKEVNYMTVDNKGLNIKDNDQFIHSYFRSAIDVIYRRAIKTKHIFTLGYVNETVADTIFKLNPEFSESKSIRYPELTYRLSYFDVDFIPYPTKGYIADIAVSKKGFNNPINLWQLTAKTSGTWSLSERSFVNLRLVGVVKLPFKQPFITQSFLGGNDMFIQGYEYYVVDGVAGGYGKASVATQLLSKHIHIPSKRIKRLNNIPIRVYGKAFVNAGYVHNPQAGINGLTNRTLYSSGVGIDIITFTDFIIKLECTFNQLGENGLYLHRRNYF